MKLRTAQKILIAGSLLIAGVGYANYSKSAGFSTDAETVIRAQQALTDYGYFLRVDGVYGPSTESALIRFQAEKGLSQTGRINNATLNALGVGPAWDYRSDRAPASVSFETPGVNSSGLLPAPVWHQPGTPSFYY